METRAIKIVAKIAHRTLILILLPTGGSLLLLGCLTLLLFFTESDLKGDGFVVVLGIVFLSFGVAMLLGGFKLLSSAGKRSQKVHLEKLHVSQQMKADSNNPSRGAAGPSRDTRINTPEARSVYCPNCGTENDEGANFCRQCGQALSAAATVVKAESTEEPTKGGDESEEDTEKGQKDAGAQNESGAESKRKSDPTNKDKFWGCAVIGVVILVILALIGSCGDLSESDVEDVEAVVPIHGLIDHHDRYNGKRVKVRGHVGSIGWEVWGGHQPGLSDFVLLGPLGGPHPNYAAFCRVDRSHVAEFRDLRQGQAVIVSGRYRYEEGTRPVELEDCRRVSE